jgi:uncharacterized membrane protein YbhN (UPF0104 family)
MTRFYNLLSVFIGLVFLLAIYKAFEHFSAADLDRIDLLKAIQRVGLWKIIISAFFYLLSHLLRSFRIAIMLNRQDISLTELIEKQYLTNGINIIIPFRIGEIYRMYAFNEVIDNYQTSVITVITERALDFLILFIGLITTIFIVRPELESLNIPLVIAFVFILSALFIYYVLPENIKAFNLFVAKRYSTKSAVRVLSVTGKLNEIITEMKNTLSQKVMTLVVLTVMIWSCEMLGFFFVLHLLPFPYIILLAFLVFLAAFIPSVTFNVGGIQIGFFLISQLNPGFAWLDLSFVYQIFMFIPAILISFILYLKQRFRR